MTPEQLVAEVSGPIGLFGAAFYFTPETLARGKAIGLDGFRLYFLGRGGVLGDVEARVVQSAFGYFEAGLVERTWNSARERADRPPRDVARLYVEASRDFGRSRFGAVDGLEASCEAAEKVATCVDPGGLALFAGLSAEPLPGDTPGRAMQLMTVLRELRGSVHLLSIVSTGLSPKAAHYIRRPNDFGMFGYKDVDVPSVTEQDREALAEADAQTDRLMAKAYAVLTDGERDDLAAGVRLMTRETAP